MTEPRWKQRYRAPALTLPRWGIDGPDHLVYASNVSGSWQVHAWDRATGGHRQVTDHPTGVRSGGATPDGASVVWFEDSKGDEIGRWLAQPFGGGEVAPLLPDAEPAWSAGLALGPGGLAAVGLASREGFRVRVGRIGGGTEELYRHEQMVEVADLSRDGGLLVVHHAEHGDNLHPALRAFDTERLAPVADLWDGKGNGLLAAGFSPVAGDSRVAVLHERTGRLRPALWDPRSGERTDFDVDLPGDVEVADWWPDASALLLVHTHLGRDELYRLDLPGRTLQRLDLPGGTLQPLDHPPGSIGGASVRPDGAVWYRWSSGPSAPEVRAVGDDAVVLRPPGAVAPPGVAYESWTFTNPAGDRVHGFLAAPAGVGPHPTVMLVHGGPHHHDADSFSPEVQAWVDHGWAVALVNYRGSTGYGKAWMDVLEGGPGRRAGGRLRGRLRRRVRGPAGPGPDPVRRRPGGEAGAVRRALAHHPRRQGAGPGAAHGRRERHPLPAPAGPQLRRPARGAGQGVRAGPLRRRPRRARRRRAHPPSRGGARLRRPPRPWRRPARGVTRPGAGAQAMAKVASHSANRGRGAPPSRKKQREAGRVSPCLRAGRPPRPGCPGPGGGSR